MLALRKTKKGVGGLSVERVAIPKPGPGEVRIKVSFAGICGTDLHIHSSGLFADRMKLPTVLGHELSGTVDAVGAGVTRCKKGDFCSIESHIWCDNCYACNMGQENLCINTRYPGVDIDGGFAPYVVVPDKIVWPQSDDISPEEAATFEPFGIAVHASLEGRGLSGMNVLIAGCGPIGLMNVMAARALGANKIIVTDINSARLKQARKLGVDKAINVSRNPDAALTTIRDMTAGNGVDVAIEYSGAAQSVGFIGEATVAGGELRFIGVPSGPTLINMEPWIFKGLKTHYISGRRIFSSWEHAIKLVRDKNVDLKSLVSHVLPIKESPKGFDILLKGEGMKILIEPEMA